MNEEAPWNTWDDDHWLEARHRVTAQLLGKLLTQYAPADRWEEVARRLQELWRGGWFDANDGLVTREKFAAALRRGADQQIEQRTTELQTGMDQLRESGATEDEITNLARLWYRTRVRPPE